MKKQKQTKSKPEFDFREINGFEDACKAVNFDPTKLPDVSMIPEEFRKPIIAVYKIMVGYKAVNNGWNADLTDWNQPKFAPWARVVSSGSGLVFSHSTYFYDYTFTILGSRLCARESQEAMHVFKVFNKEFEDFFF